MRVRTDAGPVMECQCALIGTLFDNCPREGRHWRPSTAEIGTKLLYMPPPDPVVYLVPLSQILCRLPLLSAGDYGRIPRNMSSRKGDCFPSSSGLVRQVRAAGIGQRSVLHQLVGYDLAPIYYPAEGR
jgi:hypothetical protein